MIKSGKHVSTTSQHKNVINSIMSFLPDNRPITSLQIVEDYEKCPKNFTPIHRTYDQDSDADLWRENNILFGKQTSRYLCLSKSEGLPDYVVETLKIIAEKELPPKEFSLLSRTADSEQKAWRKKQIAYKLSKKRMVTTAVTDIILCSKLKSAPEGFTLAGDVNGILVCYKTSAIPFRQPPPVPPSPSTGAIRNLITSTATTTNNNINCTSEVEKALNRINLYKRSSHPLPPVPNDHEYEEIRASFQHYQQQQQQKSPKRPAPKPPITAASTLGAYSEIEGIPFAIHPNLSKTFNLPTINTLPSTSDLEYDFQLERQILCTMKSKSSNSNLKNPFFK